MRITLLGLFLLIHMIGELHATCVLESEFGFIVNCNFKKSSLFRVRNLGGVKAHFGLGFSVGDELGLAESLGNLDSNKRRSLSHADQLIAANSVGTLPASKLPSPPPADEQRSVNQPYGFPFKPNSLPVPTLPSTTRAPIFYKRNTPQAMTEAQSLPLGVPAFKPLKSTTNIQSMLRKTSESPLNRKPAVMHQYPVPNLSAANLTFIQSQLMQPNGAKINPMVISPQANAFKVPAFQALPASVSRISTGQIVHADSDIRKMTTNNQPTGYQTIQRVDNLNRKDEQFGTPNHKAAASTDRPMPHVDLKGHTVEELAAVANVSVSAIKKAIEMRQKQLISEQEEMMRKKQLEDELKRDEMIAKQLAMYQQEHQKFLATSTTEAPTTASTTTTTVRTTTTQKTTTAAQKLTGKVKANVIQSKVMNAPKEYYPVGYEKNFDDNFTTKVDLPPTTFHCGDQKHFPGLYGDVDLGCMVFHVCALTDDGLIMKSFLCPESTLFDQTILKCNWWFYVDCKSSKTLYDSNLPVSKSYQLMKALTFFSNYKKNKSSNDTEPAVDIEALQNSVLTKRNAKKLDTVEKKD